MTISGVLAGVGQVGRVLATGGGALPWYRAGGAPAPIAAYQPRGAASLAASYINLVNPGTYDAAPGVAPAWDVATGWTFNATAWLGTGIYPTTGMAGIIRVDSYTSGEWIFGETDGFGTTMFGFRGNATNHQFMNGGLGNWVAAFSSGVMGWASTTGYKNGNPVVSIAGWIGGAASTAIIFGGIAISDIVRALSIHTFQGGAIWDTNAGHATWMPAVSAALALI